MEEDGYYRVWDQVSPEREQEIIEKVANFIIKSEMETAALFFLDAFKSVSFISGQFSRVFFAPFIPFWGSMPEMYISVFEKKENMEKLVERVNQLLEEKKEKEKSMGQTSSWQSLKNKMKKLFGRSEKTEDEESSVEDSSSQ